MVRVALFTHFFLEATHHAIRQLVESQEGVSFRVFARRFLPSAQAINTVESCDYFAKGRIGPSNLKGCDIVHAIYDGDTAFDAAILANKAGLPFVVSFHGGFDTNSKIFDLRYRTITKEVAQSATTITVPSESDRLRLQDIGVKNSIVILPVPIDPQILPEVAPRNRNQLISIGRLIPKKGFDVAIKALSYLPKKYKLTIIGDGPLREELRLLAQLLKVEERVEWLGTMPLRQTLDKLNQSSILVHPARVAPDGNAEGTPQVILWAQALGVPVISTPTGSITDILDCESGALIQPNAPQALAHAITSIAKDEDLIDRLLHRRRDIIRSRSKSTISKILTGIYESATSSTPSPSALLAPRGHWPNIEKVEEILAHTLNLHGVQPESLEFAASGGEGNLFIARDSKNSVISIKIPAYERKPASEYSTLEQKLLKEANVLKASRSGYLPRLISVEPKGRFLLREFIAGEILSRSVKYLEEAARALMVKAFLSMSKALFEEFHECPDGCLLLRDLKLHNIVVPVESPESLRFVDLGAVMREREVPLRTWSTERIGTGKWLHWPPEHHLGIPHLIDRRVDYFAVGVACYTIVIGEFPYTNSARDPSKLLQSYNAEYDKAVRNFSQKARDISLEANIEEFILGCLVPQADRRISQFRHDLDLRVDICTQDIFGPVL